MCGCHGYESSFRLSKYLLGLEFLLGSNHVNTGTEGGRENVRIKRVEFREDVRAFFLQGQSKLSVVMRCPYISECPNVIE